jgi:hypothetical protein
MRLLGLCDGCGADWACLYDRYRGLFWRTVGFTKWARHGDQSQDVIYHLHYDETVPTRAKLDNCSDQQAKYTAVYFPEF